MGAKSDKIFDIFQWIVEVINSCKTVEHCKAAKKLIDLYEIRVNKTDQLVTGVLFLNTKLNKKLFHLYEQHE